MIAPGAEWMFRTLAEVATSVKESPVADSTESVYSGAVADVLRLLVGDLELEEAPPVLQAIYRRYQEAL